MRLDFEAAVMCWIFTAAYLIDRCFGGTIYSQTGAWEEVPPGKDYCGRYMCTGNKKTWVPKTNTASGAKGSYQVYDNTTACDLLVKKGVRMIFFSGDSFMRQMYAAIAITLNGDYKYGAIANPVASAHCALNKQFEEKKCGTHALNHYAKVCNGQIQLDPVLYALPTRSDLDLCSRSPGTVIMWSFGNYNTINGRAAFNMANGGRRGVNDPREYQKLIDTTLCPYMSTRPSKSTCSAFWVSTHYRLKAVFPDESPEKVQDFNSGMQSYFTNAAQTAPITPPNTAQHPCADMNFIDVYNMTAELARSHREQADALTYDQVHWGMEVNLVKAQIVLNALINSL